MPSSKEIRDRLGLNGGEDLQLDESNRKIENSRSPREGGLVVVNGILTFEDGPGLGPEEVREEIERSREWPRR